MPHLPRNVLVHVAKCHACRTKSRGSHGDTWEPSAPPKSARCHTCHACHAKGKSICPSTTPATWNEGGCLKVPCLPRKVQLLPPKMRLHVPKCYACHAKSRSAHGDTWEPSASPEPTQCHTYHACHAKWKSMCPNTQPATPATPTVAVMLCEDDKLCQLKTNMCGQIV